MRSGFSSSRMRRSVIVKPYVAPVGLPSGAVRPDRCSAKCDRYASAVPSRRKRRGMAVRYPMPMPTLCTLNLNGIRSAERRGFSRWLKKRRPDFLCLQEMRASSSDVEDGLRSPPGYNARWLSATKKGYSGVALLTRECPDRYVVGTGFDHCADEGRAVRADFDELSVVSLYVPSGSSSEKRLAIKLEFLDCALGYTKSLLAEKRPIAICGDFNVAHTELDLARPR